MNSSPTYWSALWRPTVLWVAVYAFLFSLFALWLLLVVPRSDLDEFLLGPRLGGHHLCRLLQVTNAAWAIVLGGDLLRSWRGRDRAWAPLLGVLFAAALLVAVHLALGAMASAARTV